MKSISSLALPIEFGFKSTAMFAHAAMNYFSSRAVSFLSSFLSPLDEAKLTSESLPLVNARQKPVKI